MTTTAIIAELLIAGFQALGWILFLIWLRTGYGLTELKADAMGLDKWATLITILVVATAYGLGIIIDRLADSIFGKIDKKLRKRWFKCVVKLPIARLSVAHKGDNMAKFLDYVRSRMRLSRSTMLNALIAVVIAVAAAPMHKEVRPYLLEIVIIGSIAVVVTAFVWIRISETYYKRLGQAYEIAYPPPPAPPPAPPAPPPALP